MALELTEMPLKEQDVRTKGVIWRYTAPYALVEPLGYGRMDPSSPGRGLCSHIGSTSTCLVMHCHTTKRTILTNTTESMHMNTLIPMIDWVVGGPDESRCSAIPTPSQILAFSEVTDSEAIPLLVAIFHGFRLVDTGLTYDNAHWRRDLKGLFSQFSANRKLTISIYDYGTDTLRFGSILLDKGTGKITLPVPEPAHDQTTKPVATILLAQSYAIPSQFTLAQKYQTLFMAGLINSRKEFEHEGLPIGMQFNGRRHTLDMPLCDEARLLLRSGRLGESASCQAAILESFQISATWIRRPRDRDDAEIKELYDHILATPAICERCEKDGVRACSVCRGAWYCGSLHQKADWKAHKAWCKSHPYAPA